MEHGVLLALLRLSDARYMFIGVPHYHQILKPLWLLPGHFWLPAAYLALSILVCYLKDNGVNLEFL